MNNLFNTLDKLFEIIIYIFIAAVTMCCPIIGLLLFWLVENNYL